VPECFADFPVCQQKHAGHSFDIAGGDSRPMTLGPGCQHPPKAFQIEVLPPVCADQSECLVQTSFGIRNARNIFQFVRHKKFVRFGFIVGEVHEGEQYATEFDIVADFGQLGDRLAAKRSTKVTQKDQQQRPGFHQ
jgi:hypothetical protein